MGYSYKRKEGGEWWEARDYLRRDTRAWHSNSDGLKQKEEWENGSIPLRGQEGEQNRRMEIFLYHSIQDRGLLSPKPLLHFSMLLVPPLLVLPVKLKPVFPLIVHKGTRTPVQTAGELWATLAAVSASPPCTVRLLLNQPVLNRHRQQSQDSFHSFLPQLPQVQLFQSTVQMCWTWVCGFMVHLMWLSHLLSCFSLGFQLDQFPDVTYCASTQHLVLARGRGRGRGQR